MQSPHKYAKKTYEVKLIYYNYDITIITQRIAENYLAKDFVYVLLDCVDFWLLGSKFCEPQSVFFKNKEENNLF